MLANNQINLFAAITMKKNLLFPIIVFIFCLAGLSASQTAPEGAEKVDKIFADLAAAESPKESSEISISEEDFNSWLAVKAREKQYIRTIEVGFHDENEVDLALDMDISKYDGEGYYASMLSTMFEGRQLLEAAGKIKVVDGHFSFVINSLSINEVIVTPALIAPLISLLLPDYDLTKPLKLPGGITDIRTEEGLLRITR